MDPVKLIWLYLSSATMFFVLDMLWLGLIAKNLYRNSLKQLLAKDFNRTAAVSFYAIFTIGILIFAVIPALNDDQITHAAIDGALFGFFTYATYDLTNLATLKNWPLSISVIDILWGTAITALVALFGYGIGAWLGL